VALQRGPLVFAAEWPDNPGGKVRNLLLADDVTRSSAFRPERLNGIQVATGRAVALAHDGDGELSRRTQDYGHPLLRLGEPRTGRDARLDPQPRDERAAAAPCRPWPPGRR